MGTMKIVAALASVGVGIIGLVNGCGGDCSQTLTCGDGLTDANVGGGGGAVTTSTSAGGNVGGGGSAPLGLGDPCVDSFACVSGHCIDGVCCATSCGGTCEACNIAGSEGACVPHARGTDPEGECGQASCDGASACNNGLPAWSVSFGDAVADDAQAVAVGPGGDVYVAGGFAGTLTIGGTLLESAGSSDAFVAKIESDGSVAWAVRFGDSEHQSATALVFANGLLHVAGPYRGTPQIGSTTLPAATNAAGAWVAALDPADGSPTMAVGLPPAGTVFSRSPTTIGYDAGSLFVGSNMGYGVNGLTKGAEIAKLNAVDGALVTSVSWPNAYDPKLIVTANGEVVVAGWFRESAAFGGDTLTPAGGDSSLSDGFVVRLDEDLDHLWSVQVGASQSDKFTGVVERSDGTLVAAGLHGSPFTFGGDTLVMQGPTAIMIVELAPGGAALGALSIGSMGGDAAEALAVDSLDNVVLAGTFGGNIQVGSQLHGYGGGKDVLVVKLDPELSPVWSFAAGSWGDQVPTGVAIDAHDRVNVVGPFTGDIDLAMPHTSAGNTDVFVVQLNP